MKTREEGKYSWRP